MTVGVVGSHNVVVVGVLSKLTSWLLFQKLFLRTFQESFGTAFALVPFVSDSDRTWFVGRRLVGC